jgi:hypothetical protein
LENCCVDCGKYFTNAKYKWCKSCQINYLKENFTNWSSKDIDNLIQEIQLSVCNCKDVIFEWIPYYQFNSIKKLSKTTYSARWKNGPLLYKNKYTRNSANKEVILKYLVNLQNITNEFLNEVGRIFTNLFNIFLLY